MEIAVFAVVMLVVFAAKVASVVVSRDSLVSKDAQFSWMDPKTQVEAPAKKQPVRRVVKVPALAGM